MELKKIVIVDGKEYKVEFTDGRTYSSHVTVNGEHISCYDHQETLESVQKIIKKAIAKYEVRVQGAKDIKAWDGKIPTT